MKDSAHLPRFLGQQYVTRKQAAKDLGVSISLLRQLERQGVLRPIDARKADGFSRRKYGSGRQVTWVYLADELVRYVERREFVQKHAGGFAAAAFAQFERGSSVVDVVVALRLPPERVEEFHVAYRRAKAELVVPGTVVEEMRSLGFDTTQENFVTTIERLLSALREAQRRSRTAKG